MAWPLKLKVPSIPMESPSSLAGTPVGTQKRLAWGAESCWRASDGAVPPRRLKERS